jgi:serine/threonine protein kinase
MAGVELGRKPRRWSITAKAWALPAALALAIAGVGVWADSVLRGAVERQVRDELRLSLDANVRAVELWMEAQEARLRLVAGSARVAELAQTLVSAAHAPGTTDDALRAHPAQEEFRRLLVSLAMGRGQGGSALSGVSGGGIADTSGRIVAALDPARIGQHQEAFDQEEMLRVLAGEALLLRPQKVSRPSAGPGSPLRPEVEMSVAAPVRDAKGDVIAVMTFRLRPEAEFTRMLNSSRFGESGETYAFDRRATALSDSRFPDQLRALGLIPNAPGEGTILNLRLLDPGGDLTAGYKPARPIESWPVGHAVTEALAGRSGVDTAGYRDYRGVEVVGGWTWLERHGLGLSTKVDRAEAFSTLHLLRRAFGALLALLVLSAVAVAAYTALAGRLGRDLRRAQKLGHYTLEEKVGEGGMGAVYRARHALLRRKTAIKLIRADKAAPQMRARFEREVQLTSQLTHPNTIAVFDYGRAGDGTFYYAMEYLDGVTLDRLVGGEGALDPRRTIHVLRQLCGSLAEAHADGLIHRDVKPANVMLCVRGLIYDFVKVLDFGLAKEAAGGGDGSITSVGELTGTPLYMSPEMIRAPGAASPQSDVYAVGALAYFLVTGTQVFSGSTVVEILNKHLAEAPVPPSERMRRPVDAALEQLIMRCLHKERAARPADARALLEELDKVAAGHPPWTQAEARQWWETRAAEYRRHAMGGAPTHGPELDIELLDRISSSGGADPLSTGDITRVSRGAAEGR